MGDFQANFQRPDTGINTVEGNVAGSRAATLSKKRAAEQASFEARKQKIKADSERGKLGIDAKFDTNTNVSKEEQKFREQTVGLVSAAEFKRANAEIEKARSKRGEDEFDDGVEGVDGGTSITEEELKRLEKDRKKARKKALKEKKKRMAALSFAGDEELEDDETNGADEPSDGKESNDNQSTKEDKGIMKNPSVDTSFLPDQGREQRAKEERNRLRREWLDRQKTMKEEVLEITYSYWDGTGHRRTVHCKKGDTVAQFLELVRKDLAKEFREMCNVSSDALLYVKEDLIIPQDISFYDLIATRARGKSGPLFNFDVHDDVRLGALDARVEKDESHPGKVVERRWYDRNKHIFPASRWEPYDPAKEYGTYTIHGGEVTKKKN
jgi:protein FAM50|mmetsp:Transcript_7865/g.17531  ORF Transcript_7865/g.17531 Transcript_7865/m.17531 type:complete len:382 (-) Transcript_7865:54-1199(-)